MSDDQQKPTEDNLQSDVQLLLDEVKKVRMELVKFSEHPALNTKISIAKMLTLQFFKGVFLGLGSFLGATIVVSVLVYVLSNMEFIPFIGDLVKQILVEIKQ
jgi:hypothetical protein